MTSWKQGGSKATGFQSLGSGCRIFGLACVGFPVLKTKLTATRVLRILWPLKAGLFLHRLQESELLALGSACLKPPSPASCEGFVVLQPAKRRLGAAQPEDRHAKQSLRKGTEGFISSFRTFRIESHRAQNSNTFK